LKRSNKCHSNAICLVHARIKKAITLEQYGTPLALSASLQTMDGFLRHQPIISTVMMLSQANTKQTPKRPVGPLRLEEDYGVV
jgi:hypothetical protein